VVNYNGGDRVLRCLDCLRNQQATVNETVVVDNGSTDGSCDRIRADHPEVRILELQANRGLPAARNLGLRALTSELAITIDNDMYLDPDCLGRMLAARQLAGADIVCPRIILLPERTTQCTGAFLYFLGTLGLRGADPGAGATAPEGTTIVGACTGACILMDRQFVLEAGGFEELFFFYFEDLEFSLKLRGLGGRFVCAASAIAYHDRGTGTAGLSFRGTGTYPPRRAYLSLRHRWLAMLIHYRARTFLVLLPALAIYELVTLLFVVRRGFFREWIRAWGWLIAQRREIGTLRHRAQLAKRVPDREMLEAIELPLAPGVLSSRLSRGLVRMLSGFFKAYWSVARPIAG